MPRCSDSATFSAACRHTAQLKNSVSPSFHSFAWRSNVRGVEAMRKFATAAPDGVKRRSGASTRLPMIVMLVSPAMSDGLQWVDQFAGRDRGEAGHVVECRAVRRQTARTRSVNLGTKHLRRHHGRVEAEVAAALLDRSGVGRQRDDGVDALGLLVDLVGEPPTTPDVDRLDGAAVLTDEGEVLVERRSDRALLEIGDE